jgi:hypothetical protein
MIKCYHYGCQLRTGHDGPHSNDVSSGISNDPDDTYGTDLGTIATAAAIETVLDNSTSTPDPAPDVSTPDFSAGGGDSGGGGDTF